MNINQKKELVNLLNLQGTGKTAISTANLEKLVSMGNTILSSDNNKDFFFKTLMDQIAIQKISQRAYTPKQTQILRSVIEYGAAIQKIYIEPMEADDNDSWELENGTNLAEVLVKKPTVLQSLFENRNTWSFDFTMPEHQINSAFIDESHLAAFIASVNSMVEREMNIAIENLIKACLNNFMAEKIKFQKSNPTSGIHAINVLAYYNMENGKQLRAANALKDPDFLKYAGYYIKDLIERIEDPSYLYNMQNRLRYTSKEYLNVMLLSMFTNSTATFLQSDTFNKELLELPNYTPVTYWQGTGTGNRFEDVSKIDVITSSGTPVAQSGIIGFIFDEEALGVMFDRLVTKQQYFPGKEATHTWLKAEKGYFNDLSENGIVFYVEDLPDPPRLLNLTYSTTKSGTFTPYTPGDEVTWTSGSFYVKATDEQGNDVTASVSGVEPAGKANAQIDTTGGTFVKWTLSGQGTSKIFLQHNYVNTSGIRYFSNIVCN